MEKEHREIQRKGGERWEDKESRITPAASISQFSSSTPSTKAAIPLQVFIPFHSTSKETDSHSLAMCEFLLVITWYDVKNEHLLSCMRLWKSPSTAFS